MADVDRSFRGSIIVFLPIALEGFALFSLRVSFWIYLFGWNRLSKPLVHWLCSFAYRAQRELFRRGFVVEREIVLG